MREMQVIRISEENIQEILHINQSCEERDYEFLNALWKYVLFSKNISRTLPRCTMCEEKGKFVYEGLGGIKKVGNGVMYIPKSEKNIYMVPDIIFHYFYSHNVMPTLTFKEAVVYGSKPNTSKYAEEVKAVYCSTDGCNNIWRNVRCSYCGEVFNGTIAFRSCKSKDKVEIYHEKFYNKIIRKEKYIGVCFSCLHYSKIINF